nr:MAG TPA: hypothetical protein [Caudoviricetes sp.]
MLRSVVVSRTYAGGVVPSRVIYRYIFTLVGFKSSIIAKKGMIRW